MLYFNVFFRQLILNIEYYTIIIGLDLKNQHFAHNYKNIMIMKEIQKKIGEMYLGGGGFY